MSPEVDRGDAPRSDLSTSRTPWWLAGPSGRANDPSGQTAAAASAEPLGRDVLGSIPVNRHRERAGRSDPPRGFRVAPGSPGRLRRKSDHGGGTSPWKERAISMPARVSDATDPFAEQDLEVEGRSRTALLPPTGNGEQGARPPEGVPTARREQAVVTRYGCVRGELFEGSRRREERGPAHPVTATDHPGGSASASWERVSAKRGEPHDRLRDATSPRTSRGESRRGGEKPRGRNGSWTGGAVGPKVSRGNSGAGSGRANVMSVEGRSSHEPQERKGLGPRSELRFRSIGSRGARPVCGSLRRRWKIKECRWWALPLAGETHGVVLEGPGPVTVEGRGGRRKEPTDLQPSVSRRSPTPSICQAPLHRPRDPLTPWKLPWPQGQEPRTRSNL
jgi:hypothetical protein